MEELRQLIPKVANSESNVLITGETGTGKELVAELIHRHSDRAARPMVSVNCAAIPDPLFESELFGHERGSFTGALNTTQGQMEAAHEGTLFLDEVGELSVSAQAKLLRAIERKEIYHIGGRQPLTVDVRIVAATNRDIDALAMSDLFRRDLYFRLNIGRLHLPPLRERRSDVFELVKHAMDGLRGRFGQDVEKIDDETMQALLDYEWPGNVRELNNVLESACLTRPGPVLRFLDLPAWFRTRARKGPHVETASESARILTALERTHWNRSRAAEQLSWSRSTLYRRMAKYKLSNTAS
jgi:transcriptional regulator with PAS, ATPase and Fis domain